MAYSWGLLGFSFVKVLAPGYYARQDTRRPVRIALIALGCTMALNVAVVLPAAKLGFPVPHVLLATSTCIGAAINTVMLWRGLRRDGVFQPSRGWPALLARVAVANAAMGVLLVWFAGDLQQWVERGFVERVGMCAAGIVAGAAVYFATLFLLGLRYRDLRTEVV